MPFHIIVINFIVTLSNAYNALLIVTNKFFRRILFIIDHMTYETKNWTSLFLNRLQLADWNLFYAMISDQNSRFMSNFWQAIFARLRTKFLTNTVFHSSINDDSKRTNQTIEIAFRYLITIYSNINWIIFLSTLQIYLNNALNAVIELSLNEMIYEFKTREIVFNLVENAFVSDFVDRRDEYRKKTVDVDDFVNAKTKIYHNARHQPLMFKSKNKAYLRLHQKYTLSNHFNRKMFNQRCDSFLVKRRVERLIYELDLPAQWRIHSMIFITQLKSFSKSNSYNRFRSNYSTSVKIEKNIENWKFYEMKRIEVKRLRKFERTIVTQYFVK